MLWVVVGSFLLGAFVALAVAAYVAVEALGRIEEAQLQTRQR
jgi:RsiW-degrading membrane proteinase PrsW (M82 family)